MNGIQLGLNILAVIFGLVWLWVNLYLHYPLITAVINRGFGRISFPFSKQRSTLTSEENIRRKEVPDGGTNIGEGERLTFDVLLPAYDESEVIENSIASVRQASYDQDLINLVVLVEPEDSETREALGRLANEYDFTELCIPEAYPGDQNKPRALNYGFDQTDGDIVSVVDAENVFDSMIFERANERFLSTDVDFLQGCLDMVNEDDGWLNTLFRAEYGYWYQVIFPPFFDANYPIPMGGTTCLFRRSVLEQISKHRKEQYGTPWTHAGWQWIHDSGLDGSIVWDPENVTEDFELGLFLWQNGFKSGYLPDPSTDEESPLTLESWMGQRTRWQKGKIYTLLSYVRQPPDTVRERIHLYTQTSMPHLGAINIVAVFLILLAANLGEYDWHVLPRSLLVIGMSFIGVTMGLYGAGYWLASDRPFRTRVRRTIIVLLTVPFYWVLHWIADLRAFIRTYRGEFHWVKTAHAGRNVLSEATAPSKSKMLSEGEKWQLSKNVRVLGFLIIVAIAISTRLYNLNSWSLHGDELYTIAIRANLPPSEMLFVSHDTHPPLHYLLLHYWMELFGDSVTSVRLLSVLFSVGTVIAVYYLGRELYDDRVGLLAALITALSVHHVHYAQNARMYSLLTFFAAVSWYGFALGRTKPRKSTIVYVPATIFLLYTHLFAVFIILAQNIFFLISEQRGRINWRRWVRMQSIVAFAGLPVVAFALSRLFATFSHGRGPATELIGWIEPPTPYTVLDLFLHWIGAAANYPLTQGVNFSRTIAALMTFIYVVLVVVAVVRYRADGEFELTGLDTAGQMILLILVPVVVPFALSHILFPIFFSRYAIPASIGLYLLVGKGIVNLDRKWLTVGVIFLVVLASSGMLADHYTNKSEEPFEGAVQCLEAESDPNDPIVVQTLWENEQLEKTPLVHFEIFSRPQVQLVPPPDTLSEQDLEEVNKTIDGIDQFYLFAYFPGRDTAARNEYSLFGTINETHEQTKIMGSPAINLYQFNRNSQSGSWNRSPVRRQKSINNTCSRPEKTDQPSELGGSLDV